MKRYRLAVATLVLCLAGCGLVEFAVDGNHHVGTPKKNSSPECQKDGNSEECIF